MTLRNSSQVLLALAGLALLSGAFVVLTYTNGWTLWYGDAQAHVNIARRVIDSRTPGIYQIGTVWLPLPHALMLLFVWNDWLWRTGLAGAIPAALSFIAAGALLFAIVRRTFDSAAAAWAALAVFALNPNLLYLQATPMTEPMSLAAMAGLLYATVRFAETPSFMWAAVAGLAGALGSLTRYEGWFVLPFAALFVLWKAGSRRLVKMLLFCAVAGAGPLFWLAFNRYFWGNALEFYNGPWSAQAIYTRGLRAGLPPYPGAGDWETAAYYVRSAAVALTGLVPFLLALPGVLIALWRRALWPLLLLLLTPLFYVWSLHAGSVPIYIPSLWPHSYYNTRYPIAVLLFLGFAAGAAVLLAPRRPRPFAALAVALLVLTPWLFHRHPDDWICWKESEVNSISRRAWTAQAAAVLAGDYHGGGIFADFGDLTGIFARAGIPLRETFHEGNVPAWDGAVARPDLMLFEKWAVAMEGDTVYRTVFRASPRYGLVRAINVPGAPAVYIWRRN